MELWKIIKGFTNYELSNQGKLRNVKTKKLLKTYVITPNGKPYSTAVLRKTNQRKTYTLYIHRLVHSMFVGPIEEGLVIDHKDRDSLNNSWDNLQAVTRAENNRNRGSSLKRKYKGVYKTPSNKYQAKVTYNKKVIYIGTYKKEIEAAQAYDLKVIELGAFNSITNQELGLL